MKIAFKKNPSEDMLSTQLAQLFDDEAVAPEGYELLTQEEIDSWLAAPEQVAKKQALAEAHATAAQAYIQAKTQAAQAINQTKIDALVAAGIPSAAAQILVATYGGEN